MRVVVAVVVAGVAGCLGRPIPHGVGDASTGDGIGDGDGTVDVMNCAWSAPIGIPTSNLALADSATSPWLSDDRTDLYFTRLANSAPLAGSICEVRYVSGSWANPTLVLAASGFSYANPVLAASGTLWFDRQPDTLGGPRYLGEYRNSTESYHIELTNVEQPAPTPDGSHIYLGLTAVTELYFGVISGSDMIAINAPHVHPSEVAFESASVSSDGTTLYVTGDEAIGGTHIYIATPSSDHQSYTSYARVPGFQIDSKRYFDPSISADGRTLVFASNFEGGQSKIYYVTRDAGCSP